MENKNATERLYPNQMDFYNRAIDIQKHQISLFEAPTGFGKSVIVDTIAETLALRGKKIIIATPTNQLAVELLDIFKHDERFEFDSSLSIDIVLGVSNYLDVNNITSEVYKYIDKSQLQNYIENIEDNHDYLIEKLFNTVDIEEPHKKIVQDIICAKEKREGFSDFRDMDISITNYANLLTNVFYVKDFDISEYIVIGDEVHQMMEAAENMLTNSFSLFRMSSLASSLKKELENAGVTSPTLYKMLAQQKNILSESLNRYSTPEKAGDSYTVSPFDENGVSHSLKRGLLAVNESKKEKTTFSQKLDTMITKAMAKTSSTELRDSYSRYKSELREMVRTLNTPEPITVYLSPSKGYPTLNASRGDVRGWMLTYFWDKVEAFIGVSATLKTGENDTGAFMRLGLIRGSEESWDQKLEKAKVFLGNFSRLPNKGDEKETRLVEFLESQKRGYEEGWLTQERERKIIDALGAPFFDGATRGDPVGTEKKNERVEHIKYGVIAYDPVFKKEQANCYLPSKDLIAPQPQGGEKEKIWFDMVAQKVFENFEGKNTLVLCGSFYEVDHISQRLHELIKEVPIHSAQKNTPSAQIISRFVEQGGIMVGTRNFGIGLNLPGKLLEKLFVTKIPFPVFTTKKWLDIKEKDKKFGTSYYHNTYISEMIATFRQNIGRLIRRPEDNGDLYILDSRYNSSRYNALLKYWLERMSILHPESISFEADESNIKENIQEAILALIESVTDDIQIKEYLTKNIDYMEEHGLFPVPLPSDENGLTREAKRECKRIREEYKDILKGMV